MLPPGSTSNTPTVDIVFGLLAVWFAYVIFRGFKPSRRKLAKLEQKRAKKAAKQQANG